MNTNGTQVANKDRGMPVSMLLRTFTVEPGRLIWWSRRNSAVSRGVSQLTLSLCPLSYRTLLTPVRPLDPIKHVFDDLIFFCSKEGGMGG